MHNLLTKMFKDGNSPQYHHHVVQNVFKGKNMLAIHYWKVSFTQYHIMRYCICD